MAKQAGYDAHHAKFDIRIKVLTNLAVEKERNRIEKEWDKLYMTQEVKPQDHPDFIGGWVWTELERRWIEKRIAEAILAEREACANLCQNFLITPEILEWATNRAPLWDVAISNCAGGIRARGEGTSERGQA
jgi:hypothetical protein